ncbi:MAG: CAP domain-containing protein [Myxococcota bacterium]|nr:CAP domain-containing protein [Myxococcota bacterium]
MSRMLLALSISFFTACGVSIDKVDSDAERDSGTEDTLGTPDTGPVDADGDGLTSDEDCDDSDASMPINDADCDGVLTADDCDDSDTAAMSIYDDSDCNGVANRSETEICERWQEDRSNLAEGTWSGSVSSCNAGSVSSTGMDNALRQVNLFRWLSELPPVSTSEMLNGKAQECALMMDANNTLTHNPSSNFGCYTGDGAQAASSSNLSPYPGVYSVELYMSDPGNETTLGHRRWILSDGLGPIGLGSTEEFSCMWVHGGSGSDSRAWTAWPPAGIVPLSINVLGWADLEETGWSLQSDLINLDNATVTITRDDGTDMPVTVTELGAYYGSRWAISMVPSGWVAQAGFVYSVEAVGDGGTIQYRVEFTDCDG